MTIWTLMCYDEKEEYSPEALVGIFSTKEKAEKEMERQKNISSANIHWYIDEWIVDNESEAVL